MIEIETAILKVVSRCNIDCRYCYVYNMGDTGWTRGPKQMSRTTCQAMATKLGRLASEQERPLFVVLHGGEPLLLGISNLEYIISSVGVIIKREHHCEALAAMNCRNSVIRPLRDGKSKNAVVSRK